MNKSVERSVEVVYKEFLDAHGYTVIKTKEFDKIEFDKIEFDKMRARLAIAEAKLATINELIRTGEKETPDNIVECVEVLMNQFDSYVSNWDMARNRVDAAEKRAEEADTELECAVENYHQLLIKRDDLEASRDAWKNAVIDATICDWVYKAEYDNNPRLAISELLAWNEKCTLDPLISKPVADLVASCDAFRADAERLAEALLTFPNNADSKRAKVAIAEHEKLIK